MGFDSFGLPAENAAIKTGVHPRVFTDERIEELRSSIARIGAVYDWRREIKSHDPLYIQFTQWIFLKFLEAGLAYRKKAPVNWCPGCQTVLANEQVLADGTCERSGDKVEKRDLEQWFFKITDYAQQLLDDIDDLDWPERVKTMQRNWIGRSEGAEFDLAVCDAAGNLIDGAPAIRVFTTRPDTSFGMTYAVLAPEHPLVPTLTTDDRRTEVEAFVAARRHDQRGRSPVVRGSARQTRHLHRRLSTQSVQRTTGPAVPRRLRAHGLRHRRHHGRPCRGPARLGLRRRPTTYRSFAPCNHPKAGTARRTAVPAPTSTAPGWTASKKTKPSRRPSSGSRREASVSARSTFAFATGW